MSKSRLESELVVPHDVDFAIFNLSHGDDTCLTDGTSSDTCSVLLQSLNRGGDGYWLVDSGASVCVVTPNELKRFKHSPIRSLNRPMQAANGSDVLIDGFTRILLQVKVCNPKGEFVDGVIPLDVMVGQTSFCILSVCKLGELGWTTSIGKKGCSMIHESSGVKAVDVSVWHDTPWLFVSPYEGEDETFLKLLEVDVPPGIEKDLEGKVSVLTPQEMAAHRLRGHVPFEPSCETCQSCKGVHRHARKRTNKGLDVVIQADFAFFNRDSELVTDLEDDGSLLKFLVLKETFSSSHGAVLMSNDKQRDQQALIKWLDEFGLRTSDGVVSIELQTDAEDAVSSFVAGCSQYAFHVKKAAPQSHESAGHAERTVRAVKESFKTMLLDFQGMGYTLNFSKEIVGRLLIYICMAHNNFRLVQGSSKTPREISVGKVVSKDQFALFGTKVLAELPDSILKQKKLPRFSPAVFLHPDFASMGSVVMGKVRVGQELVIRTFIAKSLKLVLPIEIDNSFGLFVQLTDERSGLPVLEDAKEGGARILPEGQGLSCPASGPPLKWIEENGITQGCTACKSIEIHGTRKSRVHSRKCCERYEKWLAEQASVADLPREEIGDRPRDPSAEFEEFLEEFRPDSSVNRPTKPDDGDYSPSIGPASPDVVGDDDEKMSEGMVDKSAMSPDGERLDSPGDGKRDVEGDHVDLDLVRAFKRTRRCPACESGMSAPGIRHNAECKRARASVGEEYERVTKARRVTEATADELVQGLSPVLTGDPHDRLVRDLSGVISGVSEGNSLGGLDDVYQLAFLATKSDDEVRELPLMSVKFESEAGSEVVPFGSHSIRVWKPSSSVDDTTLKEMSGESTFLGMKKEVQNLSDLKTGDLYTWAELEAAGLTASCRVIPCRWVTVDKGGDVTRARIVIKDCKSQSGESARSLGISSPTPSSDALQLIIGLSGLWDLTLGGADVTAAFMATPLRKRDVVVKLPMSLTSVRSEPLYLHLAKALNGLRIASQEWICYLSGIVSELKLKTDGLEPCLFAGELRPGVPCMILVYVDDLLIAAPTAADVDKVINTIGKHVVLRKTGMIEASHSGGGQLKFLGRLLCRQQGERSILIGLPQDYLESTFRAYGLKSASGCAPDITIHLEKENEKELSSESYSKFRAALGKLSWYAQTRQDIRAWVAMLATQQAKPTEGTEKALRAILRFLMSDGNIVLRMPSNSEALKMEKGVFDLDYHLVGYSDASHAPLRSTGRRGVSGGVISVCGFLLKSLSRHQQMVSLSSMEAELFALQGVAQELASLGKLVGRVLKSLGRISVDELPSLLMTDSESSLKLLKNLDTPRKSRHLEIKLEWIKMQVNSEKLAVVFKRGTENPADLLTKCLATSLYVIHRSSLGFETCDGPIASITKSFGNYILIEVCCQPNSALSQEAKKKGMSYIGINDNMEQASVFKQVGNFVREFGHPKVFVHVSSPCASGSPLRYLSGSQPTDADFEWFAMFPWVSKYLALGHYSSFELPWRNSLWKHHLTIETLRKNKHDYHTMLHLCATGAKAKNGQSIGKVLGITSNSKQFVMSLSKAFGQCTCVDSHASMNEVDWSETAFYNNCMAKVMIRAALESLKHV